MLTGERAREVHRWFREQITAEQAETHFVDLERDTLALLGTTGGWLASFRERIVAKMQPGDELWRYDNGPEAWVQLHGERGLALVRAGQVVGLIVECRN